MRKTVYTIVGGTLVFFGLLFVIVPGPSLILLIPGLYLLSKDYPSAEKWLRKCQRLLKSSAIWLDRKLRRRARA